MRIGYYAHHHGSGHCRQADKLAKLLPANLQSQLVVFTSLLPKDYLFNSIKEAQVVRLSQEDELPSDVLPGRAGQYWQPSHLHYSPVGNIDIQKRSWQILHEIRQRQIDLMIIDVSVEVAMLCRAASIPYVYVRLAGERDDAPHLSAFAGALGLLVPYPKSLEALTTPDWVRQKSLYLGFITDNGAEPLTFSDFIDKLKTLSNNVPTTQRLDHQYAQKTSMTSNNSADKRWPAIVTVIKGYGGHEAIDAKLATLRDIVPHALIISLGPINDEMRQFVDIAAHVDEVTPFIAHSDLLVMACGLNAIAHVDNYATPLVVLPDARPHREQDVMAEALIAQKRALSWEQFIAKMSDDKNLNTCFTTPHKNPKVIDNEPAIVAQRFMKSLVTYKTVKVWFQEWLLPQLAITVEI